MFEPEWMEFFQRESPFAYYCVLFIQLLVTILSYFAYVVLCFILIVPIFMIYTGTKSIKIRLMEDKKHKKLRKQQKKEKEINETMYLDRLDKHMKKKKKHK
jgi:hypothetical protein